jgi:hypothetical protein
MASTLDLTAGCPPGGSYDGRVGFNPFRRQRTSTVDLVLVVGFVVVTLAFVAWGFLG